MIYATIDQIRAFEIEHDLTFMYRDIRGLHFKDNYDYSHYIKPEQEVIEWVH